MVVLAQEGEEGGGLPCTMRPPLEHPAPQEQTAPLPNQDILDAAIMDLRALLDIATDLDKAAESMERACVVLLGRAEDIQDTRHHVESTVREYNTA
jgi:hypothetical protein